MREFCGAILLLGMAGCTAYQPVSWDGRGSWAEARQFGQRTEASPAASGLRHEVAAGETLSEIAVGHRVPMRAVARLNGIRAPYHVQAGQILALPVGAVAPAAPSVLAAARPAQRPVVVRELPKPAVRLAEIQVASFGEDPLPAVLARPTLLDEHAVAAPVRRGKAPALSGNGFLWPVRGSVTSEFGSKPNGTRNDGINIRAREGTPVMAAENGVVVYAGDQIAGYGRMLLISHADGFVTAYAHNSRLLVDVGQQVDRGQRIAAVGQTGNVNSPQLHFEIRDGKKALDPVALLDAAVTQVASVE